MILINHIFIRKKVLLENLFINLFIKYLQFFTIIQY